MHAGSSRYQYHRILLVYPPTPVILQSTTLFAEISLIPLNNLAPIKSPEDSPAMTYNFTVLQYLLVLPKRRTFDRNPSIEIIIVTPGFE